MSSQRNHGREEPSDRKLARTATTQKGIVALAQLQNAGIGARAVQHRAETGRLHRLHRAVYAVGHESIGRHGELLAAVLACGESSVISHGTAAELWSLRDQAPTLIDMIVPCETGRKLDGIRARRCRFPTREEVAIHEGIPCTTPARTLVDLAGVLGWGSMRRTVERATVLGLLDIAALDAAIHRAKGRPGMPILRAVIVDWRTAGTDGSKLRSELEARMLSLIVARNLPLPLRNQVLNIGGDRLEVDFLWPEQGLIAEVDGHKFHGTKVAFERDRRRDQNLSLAGYHVVRFTWNQIVQEPEATTSILRRLLAVGPNPPPVVP
jgi:very-short-patch-repair endonuclease